MRFTAATCEATLKAKEVIQKTDKEIGDVIALAMLTRNFDELAKAVEFLGSVTFEVLREG